jgi:hypothetical protein
MNVSSELDRKEQDMESAIWRQQLIRSNPFDCIDLR